MTIRKIVAAACLAVFVASTAGCNDDPAPATHQISTQELAADTALSYLREGDGISKAKVVERLTYEDDFTPEEAQRAADFLDATISWKEQAILALAGSHYRDFNQRPRGEIVRRLMARDEFTHAEAVYAYTELED